MDDLRPIFPVFIMIKNTIVVMCAYQWLNEIFVANPISVWSDDNEIMLTAILSSGYLLISFSDVYVELYQFLKILQENIKS